MEIGLKGGNRIVEGFREWKKRGKFCGDTCIRPTRPKKGDGGRSRRTVGRKRMLYFSRPGGLNNRSHNICYVVWGQDGTGLSGDVVAYCGPAMRAAPAAGQRLYSAAGWPGLAPGSLVSDSSGSLELRPLRFRPVVTVDCDHW